jgi:hypothetical protein
MDLKEKTIQISVDHWIKNHTGISALDLSRVLKLPHMNVLKILQQLRDEGKGALREDVELTVVTFSSRSRMTCLKQKSKTVITSIFFPSEEILSDHYNKNLGLYVNNGEYLNRLHLGGSPIQLCFFDSGVLKKYIDNPSIYCVHDNITGGYITLNSDHTASLTPDKYEEIGGFALFRYGKRIAKDGSVTIAPILHDLAELPVKEQKYWASFEIEAPSFRKIDPSFDAFTQRTFAGQFVDSHDPLEQITTTMESINRLMGNKLFLRETNPSLHYPMINTEKELNQCLKELYKLISDDNLNSNLLKQFLQEKMGYKDSDFLHKTTGRPLSQLQLLKLIFREYTPEEIGFFDKTVQQIKDGRTGDVHKIGVSAAKQKNYGESFVEIASDLLSHLQGLESVIKFYIDKKGKVI